MWGSHETEEIYFFLSRQGHLNNIKPAATLIRLRSTPACQRSLILSRDPVLLRRYFLGMKTQIKNSKRLSGIPGMTANNKFTFNLTRVHLFLILSTVLVYNTHSFSVKVYKLLKVTFWEDRRLSECFSFFRLFS